MIAFTVKDAAAAVGGKLNTNSKNITVNRLFTDSREADGECGLFFALRGEKSDGHAYLKAVLEKGNCAFVDREDCFFENTVLVPDVKKAIYDLALWYRNTVIPNVKAVCVTGSVGKTTTKDMMGLVFSSCSQAFVTSGNKNSLIGVPLSVMSVDPDREYAVLELGMSKRGEISRLSNLAKPYLSVITTVGSSHLEALGSIENIKNEKFDILEGADPNGKIVLNADNSLCFEKSKRLGEYAVLCSLENDKADFFAADIIQTETGSSFDVCHNGKKTKVTLSVSGRHNILDALLAFASGVVSGFDENECALALGKFRPKGNRQNKYTVNGITVIADCYNASPESMSASLEVLKQEKGRKIAVLGDMLELGKTSKQLHEEVAKKAAECADVLVFVGDMAEVYKTASQKECKTFKITEKPLVAKYLNGFLQKGDTVLFKASNGLHLEDIIKEANL